MDTQTISPARQPRALVPFIKHELALGDKAAEEASAPHYERAGVGLIELACADDTQDAESFWIEAVEEFGRDRKVLRAYMEIAFQNRRIENANDRWETLADFMRSKGKLNVQRPGGRDVHDATKDTIKRVTSNKSYHRPAARMRATDDRKLRQELALELIDIGYRALAVKLHPDKRGGSVEAMARLNDVRRMLKASVER